LPIEIPFAAIERRTGVPRDLQDDRKTASTSGPNLGRRKQPPFMAWSPARRFNAG